MTATARGITRRAALAAAALPLAGALPARRARGQSPAIRIGVLTDLSGPYSDNTGEGSAVAARLAIEDFMRERTGIRAEVLVTDFQNRPEVGLNAARTWYDREGVDMILDVPNSAIAFAVAALSKEKNKVAIFTGAASSDLTGRACGPNHLHWVYDTWSQSHATATALVAEGGDTWYFITADYAFGHALERDTAEFVRRAGGRVLGSVRTPFPGTTDFSSFLVQAAAARPKVIGLANAGTDTINCIKQAAEFGLARRGIRLASLLMFLPDVHALGLNTAQGLICTETFYWDLNDRTRAFTRRIRPHINVPLCMNHAGGYAAVLHYLKAVADMGVAQAKADGRAVVARMKAMPTDDDCFGPGRIREDGRKLHPAYLFQVKAPGESRGEWDYYKLLQTTPAEEAFRPLGEGGCPLVRS
jgi:branched-chain amino acid transport system substrate-binding protein